MSHRLTGRAADTRFRELTGSLQYRTSVTPPYADTSPANPAPPGWISDLTIPAKTRKTTRRVLAAALVASLAVHVALSLRPVEIDTPPDSVPLQATITELP